ncbi:hypothetical protein EVAR_44491_1 [Eumeta japonica]|uniref:Uncharacterized protein n=1 Tax=Eumeta variegata TaxID=151549 RepID=A0A4C1WN14_EUMVA|nr:hypothetical protein EVAR_44491_1 [Eumeta japonica]
MVKNHALSIDQFRLFFLYFLLESHQLLAVEIRVNDLKLMMRVIKAHNELCPFNPTIHMAPIYCELIWVSGLMMEPEGKHRNSIMKQRILAVFGLVEIVLDVL